MNEMKIMNRIRLNTWARRLEATQPFKMHQEKVASIQDLHMSI